jgi:hypothetical protein
MIFRLFALPVVLAAGLGLASAERAEAAPIAPQGTLFPGGVRVGIGVGIGVAQARCRPATGRSSTCP